jgi:hypothetical protein
LGRIVTSPALYAGWAAFVLIALPIAYDGDPYIYGFVTLGLAALSAAIGLAGLLVAVLAETLSLTARAIIIVSIVAACAAATLALRVLGTFNWA